MPFPLSFCSVPAGYSTGGRASEGSRRILFGPEVGSHPGGTRYVVPRSSSLRDADAPLDRLPSVGGGTGTPTGHPRVRVATRVRSTSTRPKYGEFPMLVFCTFLYCSAFLLPQHPFLQVRTTSAWRVIWWWRGRNGRRRGGAHDRLPHASAKASCRERGLGKHGLPPRAPPKRSAF